MASKSRTGKRGSNHGFGLQKKSTGRPALQHCQPGHDKMKNTKYAGNPVRHSATGTQPGPKRAQKKSTLNHLPFGVVP